MKIILIRKSKPKSSYHSAAILIEPRRKGRAYLIGVKGGVVREIPTYPDKGETYAVYDVAITVRDLATYQPRIEKFLEAQIGKKASGSFSWASRAFPCIWDLMDREKAQRRRKDRKVWTSAELIYVSLKKAGCWLYHGHMPFEMSPSYLSKSGKLYSRCLIVNEKAPD